MKQETFEEAAKRMYGNDEDGYYAQKRAFKIGAEWQRERSYSKKEVLAFGKFCIDKVADFLDGKGDQSDSQEHSIEELFEQFKKK